MGENLNSSNDIKPFGADSHLVGTIASQSLVSAYLNKFGMDISRFFHDLTDINLYECSSTGMRFWRPASLAGDENFYHEISHKMQNYYKTDRWEYADARSAIGTQKKRVLEVGCGRGFFLKSLEPMGYTAIGIELNNSAIAEKVTQFEIRNQTLESISASEPNSFDAVCSFHVLEHVTDPAGFIRSCASAVRPGGLIILSTPNYEYPDHFNNVDILDMPPHHLNHFTSSTYRRIATCLGLELVSTKEQVVQSPKRHINVNDSHSLVEHMLRRGINKALCATFGMDTHLGHTLLAVFRKTDHVVNTK